MPRLSTYSLEILRELRKQVKLTVENPEDDVFYAVDLERARASLKPALLPEFEEQIKHLKASGFCRVKNGVFEVCYELPAES